jgi:hypothetical protein
MADDTYYSLLEVSEAASAAEIKAAYLRLIREVHPDRLANAPAYWQRQAEEKAKEVNEAYTVLSNREKRRLYDAQLASYRGSNGANRQASGSKPSSSNPAHQQSPTAPGARSSSGTHSQSGQSSGPSRQQSQTSSASPPSSAPASHSANHSPAQRKIRALFAVLGIRRPKLQLWVSIGMIAVGLLSGKIVYKESQTRSGPNERVVAQLSPTEFDHALSTAAHAHDLDADLLACVVKVENEENIQAIDHDASYLDALLKRYHDNLALALAALHSGPAAVDLYKGIPPDRETRIYVARVIHEFNNRVQSRQAAKHPAGSLGNPDNPQANM